MLGQEFMRNAFLAGGATAVACGLVGWFVVLRAQVFAADALSHAAFTGALAAAAAGRDVRVGLFAATAIVALGLAVGGRDVAKGTVPFATDEATVGSVFAWLIGRRPRSARLAAVVAIAASGALIVIARPLLLATVDPAVAVARGVPVRGLTVAFLLVLAATCAQASQTVGALLLLGLVAAPAGAARLLTARPWRGLALSAGIAVACTWGGLAFSYEMDTVPPSTAIVCAAGAVFLAAGLVRAVRD